MAFDVCVYGTVCLDRMRSVDRLPLDGGYVDILEEVLAPGGEALNTAVALSRWGARVALVGNDIGDDESGREIVEAVARDAPNLDLRFIAIRPDAQTPVCDCYVAPDGRRAMFGQGFRAMASPDVPSEALDAKVFTAEPNAREAATRAVLQAADKGLPIVAMDFHRIEEAAKRATILQTSYEHLSLPPDPPHLMEAAAQLHARFGATTVITAGEHGYVWIEEAMYRPIYQSAYVAPKVIDTTGSGDAFRAGYIFAHWLCGESLPAAFKFGAAAAALNAAELGAYAGIPSESAVRAFMVSAGNEAAQGE